MTPVLVPATAADSEALLELMQEYYQHDQLAFERERARLAVLELLGEPRYGCAWLVRAVDGSLAGYCVLTFGYSLEFHGRDAFVDELYLRPQHRRRGIGRAMLAHAARHCAGLGIRSLHLAVERHNHSAQAFYLAQGFANRGQTLNTLVITPAPAGQG